MPENSTPLVLPETTTGGLADLPDRWAEAEPDRVTFSVRSGSGWADVTARTAVAAAVVVLPTPPLPVTRTTRDMSAFSPRPRRAS